MSKYIIAKYYLIMPTVSVLFMPFEIALIK